MTNYLFVIYIGSHIVLTQVIFTSINNTMNNTDRKKNIKKTTDAKIIAACALFTAIAMIFSYIESLLPIPFPVPGFRLGFANIAILAVLYLYGIKEAFIVNIVRIVLSSLLFGNINSFFFSMAGGIASLTIMILLKKTDKFSVIAVSAVGGIVHNIIQVLIAVWVLGSTAVAYLIPVFIIIGLVTGIVCGIVSGIFLKHIKKNVL